MRKLSVKDILTCQNLTQRDVRLIFETTKEMKHAYYRGEKQKLLDGKNLGMIFEEPSTRKLALKKSMNLTEYTSTASENRRDYLKTENRV